MPAKEPSQDQLFAKLLPPGVWGKIHNLAPRDWWEKNPSLALYHALKKWGKFNERDYSRRYPDVQRMGLDPILHFVHYGLAAGRHFTIRGCDSDHIKVSVIVPVYNNAEFLNQCFSSLLEQTLDEIEFLIMDDGSTQQEALAIMDDFEARDGHFKIIHNPNGGYGKAMNTGLRLARGEYIGIVESDDYIDKDMFADLYALAIKNGADVVKSGFYKYNSAQDTHTITNVLADPNVYDKNTPLFSHKLLIRLSPAIWSAIYRKDFLRENSIWFTETPGASFQDTAFNIKVLFSSQRISWTRQCYYHYRVDNSGSSVKSDSKIFCVCDEFKDAEKYLTEHGVLARQTARDAFYFDKFRKYRWNFERLSPDSAAQFYDCYMEAALQARNNPYMSHEEKNFVNNLLAQDKANSGTREIKKDKPHISVIVPFYNSEKYLGPCLASIQSQTFADFEIICVDDGSNDGSISIVENMAKTDKRFKILRQENLGAGAARNLGLASATGEYLYFADSDDIFHPTVLEDLLAFSRRENLDIAICRLEFLSQKTGRKSPCGHSVRPPLASLGRPFTPEEPQANIFINIIGWAFDKLIKKSLVDKYHIKFQEIRLHNDLTFVYSCVAAAGSIGVMDKILITKRHEMDTQISRSTSIYWPCVYDALNGLGQNLKTFGLYEKQKKNYLNYCLHLLAYYHGLMSPTPQFDLFKAKTGEYARNMLNIYHLDKSQLVNFKEYETVLSMC